MPLKSALNLEGYTVSYLHALVFRWVLIGLLIATAIFAAKSLLLGELADSSPAPLHGPSEVVLL